MPEWNEEIRRRLEHLSITPEPAEAEIVNELADPDHGRSCVRDLTARGVPPHDARVQALAELKDSNALEHALRGVEQSDPIGIPS